MGMEVTFATSLSAHRRMSKITEPLKGFNFAAFSDDYDDYPSWSVELPGVPLVKSHDLPSFILTSNSDKFNGLQSFKEQVETLDEETKPIILVKSFNALEPEALKAVNKYNLIGIGTLIPSTFLGGKELSDTSFGCDFFEKSNAYNEWLNSKPKSSVVYVSLGSIFSFPKRQMEEIA
ncbi:unnamed protein product [Ilex paraguariensis]|uniref:Uncharacterized protein n=1 Tax=Ilex paraguariensis TaxID=185542 RepID=A0ABC8UXR7_9AQUA